MRKFCRSYISLDNEIDGSVDEDTMTRDAVSVKWYQKCPPRILR